MVTIPPTVRVSYRQQYRRCGKVKCARCTAGGHGHGPYWYAFWSEGGQAHSRYLGKEAPVGVAEGGGTSPGSFGLPAPIPPLRVRTLGGFSVWRGAAPIPSTVWASQRASTLFQCLLSAPSYRLPREAAIELLWPESDQVSGAINLRTSIHLLRRILDLPNAAESYLRTEGPLLVLAPAGTAEPAGDWLDAAAFAGAAHAAMTGQDAAACRAALARYGGDYLAELPYADWAIATRESLRQMHVALLLHLAGLVGATGELMEAETCLRRVLEAEPEHEAAAAMLMTLLASSGRRTQALRVYQTLAAALAQELDVSPGADVTALRARLIAQEAMPSAAALPPHTAPTMHKSNLPVALTSFVGRSWELTAVTDALATSRLVTLTGPGGCGKTRLALQVADRLLESYVDGVWLAEMTAVTDFSMAPHALRMALGLAEEPRQSAEDTLVAFLQPRQLLLVLDNCEQLVGACAALITVLLQECPRLKVLATSRERLGVPGEYNFLVPSLAAPDPDQLPPLDKLPAYEAVALFLDRARAQRPEFMLTEANARSIAAICLRLDGLPLAIELAAARVSTLSIENITARLDDRFRLLTGGPRTALARQQTLRATLDWSYERLTGAEQALLRWLAVFAGGFTLESAEAVGSGPGLARSEVLDLLTRLVHKSMVLVEATYGEVMRYRLLETVRQYAAERLTAAQDEASARERHLSWCLALAETAESHLRGADQDGWLNRLEVEHDNLRTGLESAREQGKQEEWLRLAVALARFWEMHGYLGEGRSWLEGALAGSGHCSLAMRAQAFQGAGLLAFRQGAYGPAAALYAQALALRHALQDRPGIAAALSGLGSVAREQGNYDQAVTLQQEALRLRSEMGDSQAIAYSLHLLAIAFDSQGDYSRAMALAEESVALKRALGDSWSMANSIILLGHVVYHQGDYERAERFFEEGLAVKRALRDRRKGAEALHGLVRVAVRRCEHARALTLAAEGLNLSWQVGARAEVAQWLLAVSTVFAALQQPKRAAQLSGAAEVLREVLRMHLPPIEQSELEELGSALRTTLGQQALATAWAAGRRLSLEQAVALALEDQGRLASLLPID